MPTFEHDDDFTADEKEAEFIRQQNQLNAKLKRLNKIDKVRPAWVVMEITNLVKKSGSLTIAYGNITSSNFLGLKEFDMPVITKGFEGVNIGDTVKMVYFTTENQLKNFVEKKCPGFIDTGLRYLRLGDDGTWDKIYEDWG